MITLTIEDRDYKCPQDWSEIPLRKFIEICELDVPKKLADLYEASVALSDPDPEKSKLAEERYDLINGEITEYDLIRRFPVYYGKIIKILSDVPSSVVDRIHHEPRSAFFNQYARYIILSSFFSSPVIYDKESGIKAYEPPKIKSFKIGGKEYFLPKSLNLLGEEIPLAKEKAVTFAEAADIETAWTDLQKEGARQIPVFCAVYCRESDSVYDEEKLLERANLFQDLTMDKVWAVFFCISELSGRYTIYIRDFLNGVKLLSQEVSPVAD